jgi:hypothetical protein
MPRYSDNPLLPPPSSLVEPELKITCEGDALAHVNGEMLEGLGPREVTAEFHCVTPWSVTGLVRRGVPLREVLAAVGVTRHRLRTSWPEAPIVA